MGSERDLDTLATGLASRIEEISVCKMFQRVPPGIFPVVKDMRAQNMPPDTGMMIVTGLLEMAMPSHDGVEIFHLEGGVVESDRAYPETKKRVVISGN